MSIITSPMLLGADTGGAYQISRSLRFNAPDSAYLSRTPASAGNRTTWTWAGWVKRTSLGVFCPLFSGGTSNNDTLIYFDSGSVGAQDSINWFNRTSSVKNEVRITTQVFRDPSAWQHLVFVWDTNNSTAADRMRLYVNGVQVTSFATSTNPSSGALSNLNTSNLHTIGADSPVTGYFSGYLADIHFIDGQALDPSSFTTTDLTTGQLVPKAYTGSYGTNGFKLNFSDNSTTAALGTDTSGNGNTWTVNNLSVTAGSGNDSLVDTPTSYGTDTGVGGEVRGNYCTWNPLDLVSTTLANGNLQASGSADGGGISGTVGVSSGKWYWEVTAGSAQDDIGIWSISSRITGYPGSTSDSYGYYGNTGGKITNGTGSAYGATFASGDVIGIALDLDAGTLTFYKNGASQGTAYSGLTGGFRPAVRAGAAAAASTGTYLNAGQRAFAYTAPSGFKALCDTNLPTPVVAKPNTVMNTVLYTGNGAARSITGLAFNPDLVWLKSRSAATGHELTDSVRGVTKSLVSNSTAAEATDTNGLTAFNSDGFSLGTDTNYNNNAATYVAWAWDAGTSTVTNTAGSISSQVRANASAGFSVQTWTASGTGSDSWGHGLGIAPQFVIVKRRSSAQDWYVWHKSITSSQYLFLNSTAAVASSTNIWGASGPSSSLVYFSASPGDHVSYAFAPVSGYSSFGSYVGNGSSDGSFVYTGHKPRWLMVKRTDTSTDWVIVDAARVGYNIDNKFLFPNGSYAESSSGTSFDLLSNGFKARNTNTEINASGGTYIFASFAESPFQYARAR